MRNLLFVALLLALPHEVSAQIKLSEKGTVSQTVNGTTITVEYYRPGARERDTLFGKVVKWNETWTPGANWATTLDIDKDVRLNGHLVPKGKYSVWMIPSKDSSWTFFLNKNAKRWHTQRPKDPSEDIVRFKLKPQTTANVETLLWYFPMIQRDSAVLSMHWGTTAVAFRINTAPVSDIKLTAAQRRRYVGEYQMKYESSKDTIQVVVKEEGERLVMMIGVGKSWVYETQMIPIADNSFLSGYREKQEVVEVITNPVTFAVQPDGELGFEVHDGETKKLLARGQRKK